MRGFLDQEEGLHTHGADPDIQDAAGTDGQVRDRVQAEGPFMLSSTVS